MKHCLLTTLPSSFMTTLPPLPTFPASCWVFFISIRSFHSFPILPWAFPPLAPSVSPTPPLRVTQGTPNSCCTYIVSPLYTPPLSSLLPSSYKSVNTHAALMQAHSPACTLTYMFCVFHALWLQLIWLASARPHNAMHLLSATTTGSRPAVACR